MANRVNVPFMVASKVGSYGSYNVAGLNGVPSILIERGCAGRWTDQEVEAYQEDIRNIMRYLGLLKDRKDISYDSKLIESVYYEVSNHKGCWYPKYKPGDQVEKGSLLGEIRDCFGNQLEMIYAKETGVILYQVGSLCICIDEEAVVYGKI